ETAEFRYALLLPSLVRSIISEIGSEAGLAADYWRGGVFVYETGTRSRAVIEEVPDAEGWGGAIRITTQGGQATVLLRSLAELVEHQQQQAGLRPSETTGVPPRLDKERPGVPPDLSADDEAAPVVVQTFAQEPAASPEYFVSYAWKDDTPEGREREEIVDRLCDAAEAKGTRILRDKQVLGLGDRISKFMRRLGGGDRVFVVLSEKYLRSRNCMFELSEVWRNSR
ncbi:toll/interleukin-1 receptor domain-containing protein, partial [Rhodoplanes sp. SY1]|uniref:toll/interleukin-1 receptor domain-containing protein n=1 Tax=Rhodoplanes sp. SY1 TaxID=3166646 RepID=UPI0038B513C3